MKRFSPLLLVLVSTQGMASANNSLKQFFDSSGYNANVTDPVAYEGQSANYYSGGSLFVRTNVVNAQLASVTMPSVGAGCSGIDLFMGGFSHISSDELSKFGKAIIHNAPPFLVNLALQTWAPQLKQNLDNLQAIADKWLNQSISSCEAAQAAVGGLAAFAAPATKKHVCATLGTQTNAFSDWVEAQAECNNDATVNGQLDAGKNNGELEGMMMRSHNVAWAAMMKNTYFESDPDLAQFAMSLSGTFIYDQNGKPSFYPSLLKDDNNMIDALLNGGQINRYTCNDTSPDACLVLTKGKRSIAAGSAFQIRLQKELDDLWQKVLSDQALTDKQKGFIELMQTPILKFLFDSAATGQAPNTPAYANMLAVEMLNRYLNQTLGVVEHSLSASKSHPDNIEAIKTDIARAKQFMHGLAAKAMDDINAHNAMIAAEQAKQRNHRKSLAKRLPSQTSYQE